MNRFGVSTAVLAACAGVLGLARANAQEGVYHVIGTDRNLSVRDRPKPELDATGVDFGAFRFYPEVSLFGEATNNVFAAPSPGEEEDTVTRLRLSGLLQSEWSNHELRIYGAGTATTYSENPQNDYTGWNTGASARLDVTRDFFVFADANFRHEEEPPMTTPSVLLMDEFVQYDETNFALSVVKEFNAFRVSAGARQSTRDYDDGILQGGGVLEADDRDRTLNEATLRADVAVNPGFGFFVEGRVNQREFDLEPPATPINRNSEGYSVIGGISFEATNVIRGELGAGVYNQSYDQVGQADSEGTSVHAAVDWQPDELVSIRLSADRSIADTGALNAVSEVRDNGELMVDYEFRRNVILGVGASATRAEYEGIDRQDDRWSARATADWQVNRMVGISLRAERFEQDSEGVNAGRDYSVDQVTIGLHLRR